MTYSKPIVKPTFTKKEAVNAHLAMEALIRALDEQPDEEKEKFHLPLLKRFNIALASSLKSAGCVFDGKSWRG